MTQLTNFSPASTYGDLLTTNNAGGGLTNVLQNLQDGLGNNSPIQIATNSVNFNRTGGRTFRLDGVPLTVSANILNGLQETFISGTLSAVEVMGMSASCIEVIPSLGANSLILINTVLLSLVYNSVAYQNGGDVYLQYSASGVAAGNNFASEPIPVGLITSVANAVGQEKGFIRDNAVNFLPTATVNNSQVCITNAGVPFINGDSILKYYISYSVIDLS
jgi:hypothetical protein